MNRGVDDDDDTVREALQEIDHQDNKAAAPAAPPPPQARVLPSYVPGPVYPAAQYPTKMEYYPGNYPVQYVPMPMPPAPGGVAPAVAAAPPPQPAAKVIRVFGDEIRMAVIVTSLVVLAGSPWFHDLVVRTLGYVAESAAGSWIVLAAKVAAGILLSYVVRWVWARTGAGLHGIVWSV